LVLRENARLDLVSQPGEDVLAFGARCREAAHHKAVEELEAETLKFRPRFLELNAPMPPVAEGGHEGSWLGALNPLRLFGLFSKPSPNSDKVERLTAEWRAKQKAVFEKWQQIAGEAAEVTLKPRRDDVKVTDFGLAWAPFWQVVHTQGRAELVPAYR
jgi:hypothetical protein